MRHIRDILDSIMTRRYGQLSDDQRGIVEDCLDVAVRYDAGELDLKEAMDRTDGAVIRSQVSMHVAPSEPRSQAWWRFMDAVFEESIAGEGMQTKHGFVAFEDIGEHTRGRIRHDPGRGRVIEFQCPTKTGMWFWPSEVSKEQRYDFQQQRPTSEDIERQRGKWHDPPPRTPHEPRPFVDDVDDEI